MFLDENLEDRLVDPEHLPEDRPNTLRPQNFDKYIGQERIKSNINVFIEAARMRKESLDHSLFYGPPGLGKTTMAHIIAAQMGVDLRVTSGPVIDKAGDLAAILTNLNPGDILFIDEIHRLNKMVEEVLYPAMEDFELDILIGKGPSARTLRIDIACFTLIGATTRAGLLSSPLRDRFGINLHFEFYNESELAQIVKNSAVALQVAITDEAARVLGQRSRGTPRIANRLLKRVRDFSQVEAADTIGIGVVERALNRLEVDKCGLDSMDRRLLHTIFHKFSGGPVGIDTLAVAVGEDAGTLEDLHEPYLVMVGFLDRTSRGRMITKRGILHLGLTVPPAPADSLLL